VRAYPWRFFAKGFLLATTTLFAEFASRSLPFLRLSFLDRVDSLPNIVGFARGEVLALAVLGTFTANEVSGARPQRRV
jgi:hypothetical protein